MTMPKSNAKEVWIRMYRQGLGDCFLLSFPRAGKRFHLLLDCGAFASRHYDDSLMKEVVGDIKTATGGHTMSWQRRMSIGTTFRGSHKQRRSSTKSTSIKSGLLGPKSLTMRRQR